MFLRRLGRKVLLLHCYRDGEGSVKQRRLAHFDSSEKLKAVLSADGWSEWRARIEAAFPGLQADWQALRSKAEALASVPGGMTGRRDGAPGASGSGAGGSRAGGSKAGGSNAGESRAGGTSASRSSAGGSSAPPSGEGGAVGGEAEPLLRRLARCIARETDREKREWLAAELDDLREQCLQNGRAGLSQAERLVKEGQLDCARELLERLLRQNRRESGRRCFVAGDEDGRVRMRGLELLGSVLQRQYDVEGAAAVWEERVRCCPDADALAAYGACLQGLGRWDDAATQYRKMANKDARRHFHLAALCWERGEPAAALEEILRGLVLDRSVGEELKVFQKSGTARGYWQRYGNIWSAGARRFFEVVFQEPSVRWTLRRAAERNQRPRRLLPLTTQGLLLRKAGVN
jgi:tetratricopeptide (TPR) repeat protein